MELAAWSPEPPQPRCTASVWAGQKIIPSFIDKPGSDFRTHEVIKSELQDSTNETATITKWIFAFYYCVSPVLSNGSTNASRQVWETNSPVRSEGVLPAELWDMTLLVLYAPSATSLSLVWKWFGLPLIRTHDGYWMDFIHMETNVTRKGRSCWNASPKSLCGTNYQVFSRAHVLVN